MSDPFASTFGMIERSIKEEPGWAVIGVGGKFAYTVGLTDMEHPELIIVGAFPPHMLQGVLNSAGNLIKAGTKLEHGGWYGDVIRSFRVPVLRMLDEHVTNLAFAFRYYGRDRPITALQMFLPDPDGFYPDDAECHADYQMQQIGWCEGTVSRHSLQ